VRQNLCRTERKKSFIVKKTQLFEAKPSFEFLDKSLLERGNFTAVKSEAVERGFWFFFSVKKEWTR